MLRSEKKVKRMVKAEFLPVELQCSGSVSGRKGEVRCNRNFFFGGKWRGVHVGKIYSLFELDPQFF